MKAHRHGLLPRDYVALGVSEEVGRKLLASSVLRYGPTLQDVRGVKRTTLERIDGETTAEPLRIIATSFELTERRAAEQNVAAALARTRRLQQITASLSATNSAAECTGSEG